MRIPLVSVVGAVALFATSVAGAGVSSEVTVGSPSSPFPRNKQNEPAVAIDASRPSVLAAGANEEIDNAPCGTAESTPDSPCPFTTGVGGSGIYFSFDRGRHWLQPTYRGLTARNGTVRVGPIGTLPFYYESGLVSDGDPAVAFGPRPDKDGHFSWSNGSRLYYANLTSNLPAPGAHRGDSEDPPGSPDEPGASLRVKRQVFPGFEAIGVSRIDNVTAARVQDQNNWKPPVIASEQNDETFSDKEQIWADNAASSPHFGNVYVCYVAYLNDSAPLRVATSDDGGSTWLNTEIHPGRESADGTQFGVSGCTVRTTSDGVAYVFFEEFQDPFRVGFPPKATHFFAKSTDGGHTWTTPKAIGVITDNCFFVDPVLGRCVMDGVAGARDDLAGAPSVAIANGAPSGHNATNMIVNNWVDSNNGLNHEKSRVSWSIDGGDSWSTPRDVTSAGDRGLYTAAALSPNGQRLYVTYNAFLQPYRYTTFSSRPLLAVVRKAAVGVGGVSGWSTLYRSPAGDGRGSSQNDLAGEFLGDYVYAAATNQFGVAVWNDTREASTCSAINDWRLATRTGPPPPTPQPQDQCPKSFGNSDIFSFTTG